MSPANMHRVASFVRFGATAPATLASKLWHVWQPHLSAWTPASRSALGLTSSWLWTHALYASIGSAITRNRMLACESPQYSAHWPRNVPGRDASIFRNWVRPGTTSFLPLSSGTQNEWMTPLL